ncbi:MAG TPA: type IV pilus secretin PilQ [Steroidobacteraceae bacterium]|nr:type IV pilus secretin PilQ [Steroidobacteraceae bacterium]
MKRTIALNTLRGKLGYAMLACLVALCAVSLAHAADPAEPSNKLQSVDVQTLAGKQVQLTLHLSGPAPTPLSFAIDKPARISFDLPDTALALSSRRIDVGAGGVDTILAAEANGRSRVVLNLDAMQPYTSRVEGNNVVIIVGAGVSGAAPAATTVAQADTAKGGTAASETGGRTVKSIDFRRGDNGSGRLIVKLSDPSTPVSITQQGSQILVNFSGAATAKSLLRRYDAQDFGTPVAGFEVARLGADTRIVLNTTGDIDQLAYQSDDQYVVEVSPAKKAAAATTDDKKEYKGERLTLNFQDIETRSVLQLLADASGQNIVVSDSVGGSVTLRLQNVPWDQALDIVLRTKGLDKRQDGNVIIVGPTEELAAREKAQLAAKKDVQDLAQLRSENLQVNYAKAADIAALLKTQGANGSLLSNRGSVTVDERTNMLLLSDTADHLTEIRRLVATLDIPVKQVLIESRIVIVNDTFERDLGVRTGLTATHSNGSDGLLTTSGTAAGTDTILGSALTNLQSSGSVYPVTVPTGTNAANRYNVNLPVSSPAGTLAFAILGSDHIIDLELSAAQAEGKGTIISSPRVIAQNQTEATIESGTEIPYQQSASSGATTIQFKKAVLSLKVKPLITPDNNIILDMTVSKDSVGTVVVASGGVNVPSIDTNTLSTQGVRVADGQTVVLGGILETTERNSETKVPLLGDIPVLGNLFKTTTKVNNKSELLIFVTPKILREGVSVN